MALRISAQRRSAQESLEQFDRRMLGMLSLLKSADTYTFYKRVTKTMATQTVQGPSAYCLEFPMKFLTQHGSKFGLDVTFMVHNDSERTWPIKLTERSFKTSKTRTFAYGTGGWRTFVQDNDIKVGDFLIFTLFRLSRFQVVIHRAPVEVHQTDDGDDNGDETVAAGRAPVQVHPEDDGNDSSNNNNEGEGEGEGEGDMDTEDEDDDKSLAERFGNPSTRRNADQAPPCPRFVVSICPSSPPRHLSLGRHFWDLHGDMLRSTELQLRGPNKVWFSVKAQRTYEVNEEKLTICLESGWEAFLVANELRDGDVLEFSLVGNSCFTVDLVERIDKH